MKNVLKLLAAVSVCRENMNKYQTETKQDEIRAEKVAELNADLTRAETELRQAIEKYEDAPAPETRDLSSRIELRNYVSGALTDKPVTGAEAELNKELGLDDRNVVPWEALAPRDEDEVRADAATTADDAAIAHPRAAPILRRVFENTRVAFLGARMPSVASGEPVFPIMTGGQIATSAEAADTVANEKSPRTRSGASAIESQAATFTGKMVSPKRISGRYLFGIVDAAKLPIEDVLRADLREAMAWMLDWQVLRGYGLDTSDRDDFIGLLSDETLAIPADDGAQAAQLTYANGFTPIATGIDGRYANTYNDLRVLVGTDTYKQFIVTFQEDTGRSFYEAIRAIGVSLGSSAIMPAKGTAGALYNVAASHAPVNPDGVQQALMTSRGSDAIIPIWQGVTLVRDPYTGAAKGQIALTAHMLANFELLRSDAWKRIAFKLDA